MKKKTEAISACIDSSKAEVTRIVQAERHPLTNEQLTIVLNKLLTVIAILAFTVIVIFASVIKVGLTILAIFIVFMIRNIND